MRFYASLAFLFFLVGAEGGWTAESAATHDEQLAAALTVRTIFDAKCTGCHGPDVPRPKGKFGYVLDLKRVRANPKYVVPGNTTDSDLYQMVLHDEMPGEDADVPPLTKEEKEKVRRWIEMGAPGELPPGVEKDAPVIDAVVAAATTAEPLWKHALRWVGKFHPMSTHFPVALMMVAVLAEGFAWWTRREQWLQTVRFLVVLAALGGLASAGLGWMNAYFSSYSRTPGALLWWHRWIGTGTSIWAVACAFMACAGPCGEGSKERQRFRGALLVGAALVSVTGFLGSALMYGLGHYAWN